MFPNVSLPRLPTFKEAFAKSTTPAGLPANILTPGFVAGRLARKIMHLVEVVLEIVTSIESLPSTLRYRMGFFQMSRVVFTSW